MGYLDSLNSLYFRPAESGTRKEWNESTFSHSPNLVNEIFGPTYGSSNGLHMRFRDNWFAPSTDWSKTQSWHCNEYDWGSAQFESINFWIRYSLDNTAGGLYTNQLEVGIRPEGGVWVTGVLLNVVPGFYTGASSVFKWSMIKFDIQGDNTWKKPEISLRPSGLYGFSFPGNAGASFIIDSFHLEYQFSHLPLYVSTIGVKNLSAPLFTATIQNEQSGINLYLEGPNATSESSGIPFFLDGIPYYSSGNFPMFASGEQYVNASLPIYSLCIGDPYHYRSLYTESEVMFSSGIPLVSSGIQYLESGVLPMYTAVSPGAESGIPFYTLGPLQSTNYIGLFASGQVKSEDSIPLFVESSIPVTSGVPIVNAGGAYSYNYLYDFSQTTATEELRFGLSNLFVTDIGGPRLIHFTSNFAWQTVRPFVISSGYVVNISGIYDQNAPNLFSSGGYLKEDFYFQSGIKTYQYFRPYSAKDIPQKDRLVEYIKTHIDHLDVLNSQEIVNRIYNERHPWYLELINSFASGTYKASVFNYNTHYYSLIPGSNIVVPNNHLYKTSILARQQPSDADLFTWYEPVMPISTLEAVLDALRAEAASGLNDNVHPPFFSMFTKMEPTPESGGVPLYVKLSLNGEAGVRDTDSNIPLYVDTRYKFQEDSFTLLAKNTQEELPLDRSITLYLSNPSSGNTLDQIPLFASNTVSGVYNSVPLTTMNYREGLSIFDPLYYELEDGGVPYERGRTLYLHNTAQEQGLPLYVGVPFEMTSGTPLYTVNYPFSAAVGPVYLNTFASANISDGLNMYGHGF